MKLHRNIYWAGKVLLSRNYMVVADDAAVCSIQLQDVDTIESVARLKFQAIVLAKIKESIIRLEEEHKDATTLLKRRTRGSVK